MVYIEIRQSKILEVTFILHLVGAGIHTAATQRLAHGGSSSSFGAGVDAKTLTTALMVHAKTRLGVLGSLGGL